MDSISRVQDEIRDATDLMRQNLESVVGRGEHLELLVDKSDGISSQARQFQKQSIGLRKAMWWANIKMMMTIAGAGLGLVMLIVWWKCGFAFSHCRSSASA